jgi:signal peptidase I
MPFELSSGPAATALTGRPTPGRRPDLSRFLESSRTDDDDEEGDPGGVGTKQRKWVRTLTRSGVLVLFAVLAAVLLRAYVVQPYYIPSASMEPTLHGCPGCNDDHVLVDKISYRIGDPSAGDIVVFHRPPGAQVPDKVLIKRVIGLPNDTISMTRGQVFVNGKRLQEKYLNGADKSCYATAPFENFQPIRVPKGDVYVMGDNRCNSTDSRVFGPIPESSIIGRAFAIIWPLNRIRILH